MRYICSKYRALLLSGTPTHTAFIHPHMPKTKSTTAPDHPLTHIFLCKTDSVPLMAVETASLNSLGNSERERLKQCRGKRFQEFLQSRLLLRHALSDSLPGALPPAHWHITERRNQAPLVHQAVADGWYYSLSHSHGRIAVIISNAGPCGIDLEYHRNRANIEELAKQWFHPSEVELLAGLTGDEQAAAFYRLWTMKEALIKATGSSVFSGILARSRFVLQKPASHHDALLAHHLRLQSMPFSLSVVCRRQPETGLTLGYPLTTARTISPRITTYTIHEN